MHTRAAMLALQDQLVSHKWRCEIHPVSAVQKRYVSAETRKLDEQNPSQLTIFRTNQQATEYLEHYFHPGQQFDPAQFQLDSPSLWTKTNHIAFDAQRKQWVAPLHRSRHQVKWVAKPAA